MMQETLSHSRYERVTYRRYDLTWCEKTRTVSASNLDLVLIEKLVKRASATKGTQYARIHKRLLRDARQDSAALLDFRHRVDGTLVGRSPVSERDRLQTARSNVRHHHPRIGRHLLWCHGHAQALYLRVLLYSLAVDSAGFEEGKEIGRSRTSSVPACPARAASIVSMEVMIARFPP